MTGEGDRAAAEDLVRIDDVTWELPATGCMHVPGRVFADSSLMESLRHEQSLEQLRNVACLPGIVGYSMAMPDVHYGYGFPIGGVAAFAVEDGVVSPGGVGYDINCGCRLLATNLSRADLRAGEAKRGLPDGAGIKDLVLALFRDVPAGVGSSGAIQKLSRAELEEVTTKGAAWAVEKGYGKDSDLRHTEAGGRLPGANPECISDRAFARGQDQVGTLGAGNHFLELQYVDEIFDREAAASYGLFPDQITVMIHCGSRGFGYQICDDYLQVMGQAGAKYGIELPDRQLACAPVRSEEGRRYLAAMACAANYAWANRQMIMRLTEDALLRALSISPAELGLRLVYDVAHNIAKIEDHRFAGEQVKVCVHRKGATRAFPPGHPEIPDEYGAAGQPVLIPGDMGTASYVCKGTQTAMDRTFGSTAHGAGRVLSRSAALKRAKGRAIERELGDQGIYVRSHGTKTLKEEMPEAYKDVEAVVSVTERAGISPRVARLRPIGVVKG